MRRLPVSTDWALVFVRLALGTVFIMHGWPKIANLGGTIGFAERLGYVPGEFFGVALAFIEFGGGILLLLGLGTRLAALLIATTQVIAIKESHWECGYSVMEGC
jgi:putative oxidoreductase